jgi:uncharacterized RDD family membrane protein YckC
MEDEYLDNMEREGLILAPIKIRFFAFMIDYLLMFVIVYAIYFNALDGVEDIETMIIIITDATIKGFIIKFIYESFFVYYYSATIGKIVMKIRVLQIESFDNLSLIESIGRSGIKILNEYIFYFGCMFAFMGELKQTLHDRAVKSVVVYA